MTADNTRTGPTRLAKHLSGPVEKKNEQQLLGLYTYMWMCSDIRYTRLE